MAETAKVAKKLPEWMKEAPPTPKALPEWMKAPPDAKQAAAPEKTTKPEAFGRHFLQGATANFSDEILGAVSSALGPAAMDTPRELGARWASILRGGGGGLPSDSARPTDYKGARDVYRGFNRQAMADEPEASVAGGLTGAILATKKLPSGYASAAGQGAVSGLGGSEQQDAEGMAADAAVGAGLGAAGQAVGSGLGRLRRAVSNRAGRGMAEARDLATAQATQGVDKTIGSLRGEAGGAASRASNIASNIEDIPLPETAARTMGALKETLRGQVAALDERIAAVRAQAAAMGVNPDDVASMRSGEFLSKGSKLDKAQQMAKKLASYEAARARLTGYLDDVALAADDAPAVDPYEALRQARETLRADPAFIDAQANILQNSLADAPAAIDTAAAQRQAFKEALGTRADDIAKRTEQLLSPTAATTRAKSLAMRYGLPALGGYLGAQMGGVEGAAVGLAAGAGTRPGLQAIIRATNDPGVRNTFWRGMQGVADLPWASSPVTGEEVGRAAASTLSTPTTLSDVGIGAADLIRALRTKSKSDKKNDKERK